LITVEAGCVAPSPQKTFGREGACAKALFGVWGGQDRNLSICEVFAKIRSQRTILDFFANCFSNGEFTLLSVRNADVFVQQLGATSAICVDETVGVGQKISIAHRIVFRN
jgi:hypothetical protein